MISVCMAVKNGSRFLRMQLDSILPQLSAEDEVIISDDHSTDNTFDVINSYADARIKFIKNPNEGLVSNFENSLLASRGELIFLADQDDIWQPNKIRHMLGYLKEYDIVVSDCNLIDSKFNFLHHSFFELNSSGTGLIKNLLRNSYMGCCMAFHRKILSKALPFPKGLYVHDAWIGLIGELYFTKIFISDKLVSHRKHNGNASFTGIKSGLSTLDKIAYRIKLIKGLIDVHYAK